YHVTATATSGLDVALSIDAAASSVCSLSGSTVSFTGVGTCVIDANQAGNATYAAAPQVQQSFAVGPAVATTTLTTQASGSVAAGQGQVVDTATLAGGQSPSGTITFRLYGPNDASCSSAAAFTTTRAVSGNGAYVSAPFLPTQAGTYRWVASYGG